MCRPMRRNLLNWVLTSATWPAFHSSASITTLAQCHKHELVHVTRQTITAVLIAVATKAGFPRCASNFTCARLFFCLFCGVATLLTGDGMNDDGCTVFFHLLSRIRKLASY
ncbi:unnamed protein product [Ixodes persulcatus]